jgi:hypothetical protein
MSDGRGDIARRRQVRMVGQMRRQPPQALRVGDRVRGHEGDVFEAGSRAGDEHEVHADQILTDDSQPGHRGQRILRRGHSAVDRILDRDHRGIRPALDDIGERFGDIAHRTPDLIARFGHLRQRRSVKVPAGPR